ncbi:MAG: sugar porter family MFS transporter [Pseudomonadota bacterium]
MVKLSNSNWMVYAISVFAALAGLLFGYDTGIISGAILFIKKDFALSAFQIEMVVSAVLLGALVGSGLSGRLTDRFGRRKVLVFTALTFITGSLATAFASNVDWLIFGRIILGIAIGVGSFTAPLYLAEIAPQRIRGMLVSLNQLAITIGIVFSYLVNYYFSARGRWPWMLGLGVVPAAILLLGTVFLPESPRWMLLKGWEHKARTILQRIRGDENINREFDEIQQTVQMEKGTHRLLLAKWVRPILFISLGLSFFQQVTGINTIIYYAPTILQLAGFQQAGGAILATLGIGIINVLFTIISLPLIDRWGRRPLLLLGLTGMFISLAIMGIAFYYPGFAALRWVAVGSMVIYIASFAMSLGPIMWLIISEIFPLNIRGVGASLAISASWGFNMLVSLTFLTLIQLMGPSHTFWLYAFLCVLGWLFVYFIVPETRGCSLEHIEQNLRLGLPSRELGVSINKSSTKKHNSFFPPLK